MNKNVIVVGVVVLLLLAGAGFLVFQKSKTNSAVGNTTIMESQENAGDDTSSDTLRSLMTLADRKQCAFSDSESGSSGTVYASGGQVRGDFQSSIDGVMTESHMYTDGDDMYVWIDGQTSGFKMALSALENGTTNTFSQSVDLDKPVDYSCQNWSVDSSMFELPDGVTFSDPASMMQGQGLPSSIDTPQVSCSACDSLSGDAQTQCRTALGC